MGGFVEPQINPGFCGDIYDRWDGNGGTKYTPLAQMGKNMENGMVNVELDVSETPLLFFFWGGGGLQLASGCQCLTKHAGGSTQWKAATNQGGGLETARPSKRSLLLRRQ